MLDPFLDANGIIRVGGRIRKSDMEYSIKHPILLPRYGHITSAIVYFFHHKIGHAGRGMTINEIRNQGFWVISCSSVVKSMISKCVECRRQRGKVCQQKMGDLPAERLSEEPPFTYCGIDMFGPFLVKDGRKHLKRYGVMITCMSSRAIHLETTNSMNTDSFILSLRRFINRRGNVRSILTDNGSNFVGASMEMKKAFREMDHESINNFLMELGGEWISWKRNPPYASNMGGVWERQIRSSRSILSSLLKSHGESLTDESLRTLLTEVECIVNSRPITYESINDNSLMPLSPMNLLSMKTKIGMPPPGNFKKEDMYCRKQWRRVQHLCNEFWSRWRKEVFASLQVRQKWNKFKRNMEVGDIVLLRDSIVQNKWQMAIILKTYKDDKGIVRSVQLEIGNSNNDGNSILDRPVNKLVLLVESNETHKIQD